MHSIEILSEQSLLGLFTMMLVVLLGTLAWVDFYRLIIPNFVNALIALIGIMQIFLLPYLHPTDALLGAAFGICIFSSVAFGFRRIRGYSGLGMGDVKFVGAAACWIGWQGIPFMVLLASLSALIVISIQFAVEGYFDQKHRVPFGPFLAFGTGLTWLAQIAAPS